MGARVDDLYSLRIVSSCLYNDNPFVLYLFFFQTSKKNHENLQSSSNQLPLNAQAKQIGCVDPRGLSSPTRWDPETSKECNEFGFQMAKGLSVGIKDVLNKPKIREVGEVCVGEDVGVS